MSVENQDLAGEIAALESEFGPDPAQAVEVQQAAEIAQAQQRAQEEAAQEWAGVVGMVLKPAADILTPNWGITGEEIELLANAYGECLAELFPDIEQAGPWVGAVAVTGVVLVPRLGTPRKLPPPKSKVEGEGDDGKQ